MAQTGTDWGALRVEVDGGDEGWLRVRALDREGAPCWQVELDATVGRGELMARAGRLLPMGPVALLPTDGEHYRGATSHHHQIHCLSARGELLWVQPWQVEPPAVRAGKGLVLLVRLDTYRVPEDGHLFDARLVDDRTGRVRAQRAIVLPGRWVAPLRAASWPRVTAQLERMHRRWGARVRAWLGSGAGWAEHEFPLPWGRQS